MLALLIILGLAATIAALVIWGGTTLYAALVKGNREDES